MKRKDAGNDGTAIAGSVVEPTCNLIVIGGPSGCGKSRLAREVGKALRWRSLDADFYHTAAYKRRAGKGEALSPTQRKAWLNRVIGGITTLQQAEVPTVVACSALRRGHREKLICAGQKLGKGCLWVVWLDVRKKKLRERVDGREHWFAASLLENQLRVMEKPRKSEVNVLVIDGNGDDLDAKVQLVLEGIPNLGGGISTRQSADSMA